MDELTKSALKRRGLDPDKPVSCLTLKQLYELIEFVILRNK